MGSEFHGFNVLDSFTSLPFSKKTKTESNWVNIAEISEG